MENQDHETLVERKAAYEIMVSHTTVWTRKIAARSQEEAEEIAAAQWHDGEFTEPDPTTGSTSPVGWSEVNSVSGEFEIL